MLGFMMKTRLSVSMLQAGVFLLCLAPLAVQCAPPLIHTEPDPGRSSAVLPSLRSQSAAAGEGMDAAAFKSPPLSAKPRAYWDWINGAVSLEQLTRDLEEMKDKGMGGGQMWDSGAHRNPNGFVPPGPPFLGPESVAAIHHSLREAKRLGLELGLLTSSGWNAGGPWATPEFAGKNAYLTSVMVEGPGKIKQTLPLPPLPPNCPAGPDGRPLYLREIAVIAVPDLKSREVPDLNAVVELSEKVKDGVLSWDVPAGRWQVMRFVCMNNGQQLIVASPKSKGPLIDFLDPAATKMHFQHILDKIGITPENAKEFGLAYLAVESMELAEGIQWTDGFRADFARWAGYDPTRYLPILAGWTIGGKDISDRFLYDYRKAISEQLIFSHYVTANELLDKYGILLSGEAGGPGPPIWNSCPVDALKALGNVDIPQGEFWIRHRNMFLVKEISSASHIYGKKLVDAESFTTWRRWKDGPGVLKYSLDRAFCEGLNRITYHGFAHTPHEAGFPGRSYHAGVDINPKVTWWPMARPFMDYMARCCYMLQQGQFVADVCYYYGDQAPNFWPAFHDVPEKPLLAGLGQGYDYDVVNSDVILNRMSVKDGRIVLPNGMNYPILFLRDQRHMPLEVLKKIAALVKAGATIVGPKPEAVPGLEDFEVRAQDLQTLAAKVWGPCDGATQTMSRYGAGRVFWGVTASEVLKMDGIGPDFSCEGSGLDYIHRFVRGADVYFVRNPSKEWIEVTCTFRVDRKNRPSFWDPADGEIQSALLFTPVEQGVRMPMRLPAGGSIFVVFSPSTGEAPALTITKDASLPLPHVTPGASGAALEVWENGVYELGKAGDRSLALHVEDIPQPVLLEGPWSIRFPENWGAPLRAEFATLHSWTDDPEEGIKYFSGIATYHKRVQINSSLLAENRRLYLDLGGVRDVARVRLNGKDLGILWKAPFRVEIKAAVVPGDNQLEIEVANMWINRLTGDLKLPPEQRFTHTNETPREKDIGGDEPWHVELAGLLGPVRLVSSATLALPLSGFKH
jgi:hypothetical protein